MVKYECFRCGYNTTHRGNFQHHLNRKNICNPTEENVEIEEIKKYYGFEIIKKFPQNSSISPQNSSISPQNSSIVNPQNSSIFPQNSSFFPQNSSLLKNNYKSDLICQFCARNCSRSDNLKRHLKICKKKKEYDLELLDKKNKEIELLKLQLENNKTTNNNSYNITNNNNIYINNYGNENLKHLRNKDFAGLLNSIYGAVPKLIEKIHFDPDYPENQNIKFTNKKLPYLKILKDDKWQLVHKKHELLDLIDNKCFMLKEKYYAILEKKKYNITEVQRDKIEEFMKKYNEEDKKMMLDLIERTELMLLNNS